MDRSRKMSSKQLLEEKQMKRYFRSKKRSQIRDKIDTEHKVGENPGKQLTDNLAEGTLKLKETKTIEKQGPITNNEKTNQVQYEIRKESKKVIANGSSEPQLNRDTDLNFEKINTIIQKEKFGDIPFKKKEQLLSNNKNVDISTNTGWVEDMNVTKKKSFENLKQDTKKVSDQFDLAFSKPRKNALSLTDVSESKTTETIQNVECSSMNKTAPIISKKNENNMEKVESTNIETNTGLQNVYKYSIATSNTTDIKEDKVEGINVKTDIGSQQTQMDKTTLPSSNTKISKITTNKAVERDEGSDLKENIHSKQTDKRIMNEVVRDSLSESKNNSSKTVEDEMNKADTVQDIVPSMIKYIWLDSTNVWLDKYKYNDAEKQYHQQLDEEQNQKYEVPENSNNEITYLEFEKAKIDLDSKFEETKSEEKNIAVKELITQKPRVAYEIIEEIIERTEITYHLVNKDTDTEDGEMKEQMTEFESQSLEFKQYLSQLGIYVTSLEKRVKTLEEGQKKTTGERSSSLSSNSSDEGVEMTKGLSNSMFGFRRKGQNNEKNYLHGEMNDNSIAI